MSKGRHTLYLNSDKVERLEDHYDAQSASRAVRLAIDEVLDGDDTGDTGDIEAINERLDRMEITMERLRGDMEGIEDRLR